MTGPVGSPWGTVHLNVSINIQVEDCDADTGLTVDQWNALTDDERSAVARRIWTVMAESDSGGVRVLTPGAERL